MSVLPPNIHGSPLLRFEGQELLSAAEAIVKGVLEAEVEVALIAGPGRGGFAPLLDLPMDAAAIGTLRQHGTRLIPAADANRAVMVAAAAARAGRACFAAIPNQELDDAMPSLIRAAGTPLDRGGAMCLMMEDVPQAHPAACPRQAVRRVGMPSLEPADLAQLRDGMEYGLRLSRAARTPVAIIIHDSILRSTDTLDLNPNRLAPAPGDAMHLSAVQQGRRRRVRVPRWSETGGVLRMARRLELNRFRATPSPGERVSIGFVTVGPAHGALLHLVNTLGLFGRVPILQLGLIHPLDESAVARLLTRCQQVLVLEPRPGTIELGVLEVAEGIRRHGEQPGTVWGRRIPGAADVLGTSMTSDQDLHPSILVRKIAHLLHAIRPTIQVAAQLAADPPLPGLMVPERGADVGSAAAIAEVRRIVTDVDQWLRERAPLAERGLPPTAISLDGAAAPGITGRIVNVETWDHRRFQRDGAAAIVQAAREEGSTIFLVCETTGEEPGDLERFARGVIPAQRVDRVQLQAANLTDQPALRDRLREASLQDQLSIFIVRDGPPAQFDVAAIDRSFDESDRLGYEPRQRLVRSIDELCSLRPSGQDPLEQGPAGREAAAVRTEFTSESIERHSGPRIRVKLRPLVEEVEVIRTKPPRRSWWQPGGSTKLPPPQPIHGRQPLWRLHVAGFRAQPPGLAARAVCDAGRLMGYHVRSVHDASAIGAGRRAWAQVLFTNPRADEVSSQLSTIIPFGEADVLLGLDPLETVRAIAPATALRVASPARTFVVANAGDHTSAGGSADATLPDPAQWAMAVGAVTRPDPRLLESFSGACRRWFHTDRVTDMALLGASFQMGLLPVAPEAIETAIKRVEARGFGRCLEAFEFGRRLAIDARLFTRPRVRDKDDGPRLSRRLRLSGGRWPWQGRDRSRQLAGLIDRSLTLMPGLAETDPGRQASRDFVVACQRCWHWGGLEYARGFAELLTSLYRAERAGAGCLLTRSAVLPVAECMLIRDTFYIAAVAGSAEQRQTLRRRMDVKRTRGDRLERRYLTRIELLTATRRLRADVRTSDWVARAAAMLRWFVPRRWRGTRRERELRAFIVEFAQQAIAAPISEYSMWADAMHRLHTQAVENRLRGMAMAELRMLLESHRALQPQPAPPLAIGAPESR